MNLIFAIIANCLYWTGKLFHLTYNEINVLVYYLLIPLSWCVMTDFLIGLPVLSSLCILVWLFIFIRKHIYFSMWCDWVFQDSVEFLHWFKKIGWNYVVSSVIICVFIPAAVYAGLIFLLINKF